MVRMVVNRLALACSWCVWFQGLISQRTVVSRKQKSCRHVVTCPPTSVAGRRPRRHCSLFRLGRGDDDGVFSLVLLPTYSLSRQFSDRPWPPQRRNIVTRHAPRGSVLSVRHCFWWTYIYIYTHLAYYCLYNIITSILYTYL